MTDNAVKDNWGRRHEPELCTECGGKIRTPPQNIYVDGICSKCASEEFGFYLDETGEEEYEGEDY